MNKRNTVPYYAAAVFLTLLVTAEALCMAVWLEHNSRHLISVVYFICGVLICLLCLPKYRRPEAQAERPWARLPLYALFVWMLLYATHIGRDIMARVPVDYTLADMLPIMQIMSRRFMEGQEVYAIIPEIWGGMQPIYLPSMWLPYTASVKWGFDPRWITITCVIIGAAAPLLLYPKGKRPGALSWLLVFPVFYLFRQFMVEDDRLIALGDEGPVIAMYALLALALWQGNAWLIGITLGITTLTRYSLIGWLPAYFLFVFFFQSRAKAWKIAGSAAAVGLILMVATKAIFYLHIFLGLPQHYIEAVMGQDWGKLSGTIQESLGVAKFLAQKDFPSLFRLSQFLAFGIPLLCLAAFWRFRHRMDEALFPIATLKLGVVVLYNLMIIPIQEMFYTSSFLSVALLCFFLQERE